MNILVTGGAGYIGSHTIIELYTAGHTAVVIDNLSNNTKESLKRVEKIIGQSIPFYRADCTDKNVLLRIFKKHPVDAVIHFAALKAVGESVKQPLRYYRNNIISTITLCEAMEEAGVKNLIFSSSATVYGDSETVPITEDTPKSATNPYGWTKFMKEQILHDVAVAKPDWHITLLRYFNPIGAHESGTIGEDPAGIPNNLLPYIAQVAVGKREKVSIFGGDYDTHDGTGVRDYIHVVDLAKGHVAALTKSHRPGIFTFNLGTGRGVSVLQIIKAFEKAAGKVIPYEIVDRRPGDIATCFADTSKAERELGWKAEKSILDACRSAWHWQSQNPNGFEAAGAS